MELTNQEIQTIIEIIDLVSIPTKQAEEIVIPIKNKLRLKLMQGQQNPVNQAEAKKEEAPAN